MEAIGALNTAVATIVGLITAIVSWRVLRKAMGTAGPVVGICVGALTGLGLASHGGVSMSALLIPYGTLGIAVVIMLLLKPLFQHTKGKDSKPDLPRRHDRRQDISEDPWAKEVREGGKMAHRFKARRRT